MQKIFIVEDDENIRDLVIYALTSAGFDASGFETGQDLDNGLKDGLPSMILLDIMLPDEDGISILRRLRHHAVTEKIPVIMLTAKGSELDRIKGLDSGADDYIVKPFSILELISRINAVLRRSHDPIRQDTPLIYKNIALDIQRHLVTAGRGPISLTHKEFDLLHLLLLNKDIVLSREKIMDQVWGYDFAGESRTVDMHVKTLRQKLGESGAHIKTIRGVGYKIGD